MNSNFLHTLTAYHLKFSYMKRNNPLREELIGKISSDAKPSITITELLDELIKLTDTRQYGLLINGGKVVLLDKIEDIYNLDINKKRIFIIPKAGKTNIPIQMVNLRDSNKIYNFGADWASTYPHNIFLYEVNNEYYLVCHRNGGSGCKTVLCSALNKILKQKGIKVEMNWMPPIVQESTSNYDIDKITLIYEENKSSDIADEPAKRQKKVQIKELTLSLKTGKFSKIDDLLHSYRAKEISKEETFRKIKNEVNDEQYNNASLVVKIGKAKKKVAWDDVESLIDGFDITDKVSGLKGQQFIDELKECSDNFLLTLLEGE